MTIGIPLLGNGNKQLAGRAFEDEVRDLITQGLRAGCAPQQIGMVLISHGLGVLTEGQIRAMRAEPEPERGPTP